MTETDSGRLYAWGAGHTGLQGKGPSRSVLRPEPVPDLPRVRYVTSGGIAAYAIDTDGGLWSWGWDGYHHLLGRGLLEGPLPKRMVCPDDPDAPRDGGVHGPAPVEGLPPVHALTANPETVVALATNGEVWGWGSHAGLGLAGEDAVDRPRCLEGLSDIVSLSGADFTLHYLALDRHGKVWSWGDGHEGQLGWGERRYQATPAAIPALDDVRSVYTAGSFCWAVRSDDTVWFWGHGQTFGFMADNDYRITEPVRIDAFDDTESLFVGPKCVIARKRNGETIGLGIGLGDLLEDEAEPGEIHLARLASCDRFQSISLGDGHALARDDNGRLYAFGNAEEGALGNGRRKRDEFYPPEEVEGVDGIFFVHAGDGSSFAISTD